WLPVLWLPVPVLSAAGVPPVVVVTEPPPWPAEAVPWVVGAERGAELVFVPAAQPAIRNTGTARRGRSRFMTYSYCSGAGPTSTIHATSAGGSTYQLARAGGDRADLTDPGALGRARLLRRRDEDRGLAAGRDDPEA